MRRSTRVEAFPSASFAFTHVGSSFDRVFHLVGESRHEIESAWKAVRSGAVLMAPIRDAELAEIHALMSRYWDRPVDCADATLVYLAKQ